MNIDYEALISKAKELGWTDIRPNSNGRGGYRGYMGKPPNYRGPYINLKWCRMTKDYNPPSWGE